MRLIGRGSSPASKFQVGVARCPTRRDRRSFPLLRTPLRAAGARPPGDQSKPGARLSAVVSPLCEPESRARTHPFLGWTRDLRTPMDRSIIAPRVRPRNCGTSLSEDAGGRCQRGSLSRRRSARRCSRRGPGGVASAARMARSVSAGTGAGRACFPSSLALAKPAVAPRRPARRSGPQHRFDRRGSITASSNRPTSR
jgi:hypothetical protein